MSAATLSSATGAQARGPLGDLSTFSAIVDDVTAKIEAGDLPAARTRVKDLETAWDSAEAGLKPKSPAAWGTMDKAIDGELTSLRADHPDQGTCLAATHHLQSVIDSP